MEEIKFLFFSKRIDIDFSSFDIVSKDEKDTGKKPLFKIEKVELSSTFPLKNILAIPLAFSSFFAT